MSPRPSPAAVLPAAAWPWLAALLLSACEAPVPPAPLASAATPALRADPVGVYALPAPLRSELRVVALPERAGMYRVEVHGGGDPSAGAGIAADCRVVAEGSLQGDRIDAALLPFESDAGGLEAADLQAAPRLQLQLQGDVAVLSGTFAHCPMGTVMVGPYRRTAQPRLLVDCAALPAACWNRD